MNVLIKPLQEIPQFDGIIQTMEAGKGPVGVTGLVDPARAIFAHALAQKTGRRCLILTHSRIKANKIHEALRIFDQDGALHLPTREIMPFDIEASSHGYDTERVNALYRLAKNDYSVAVAPIEAMCIRIRKKDDFLARVITIQKSKEYNTDDLAAALIESGYEKCDMVESEGQFAIRGDIFDIYSPGSEKPSRINFFGDQVETIKNFDAGTQLSDEEMPLLLILPCSEQTGSTDQIIQKLKSVEKSIQTTYATLATQTAQTTLTIQTTQTTQTAQTTQTTLATQPPKSSPEIQVTLIKQTPKPSKGSKRHKGHKTPPTPQPIKVGQPTSGTELTQTPEPTEPPQTIPKTQPLQTLPNQLTQPTKATQKAQAAHIAQAIAAEIEKIENGLLHFPMDKHFALADNTAFAASYIDKNTIIILDNDKRCLGKMETVQKEYGAMCEKLLETKTALPESCKMIAGLFEAMGKRQPQIILPDVTGPADEYTIYRQFSILTRENPAYGGRMDLLLEDIRGWKTKGRKTALIAPTQKSSRILSDYLESNGIDIHGHNNYNGEIHAGTVIMLENGPAEGFEILEAGLCVVGSGKIFKKTKKEQASRAKPGGMDLFTDLKPGDYVVHDYHGIGRYIGIENIIAAGVRRDYVKVEYKKNDYVYIPADKLDSIQKYIGSGSGAPALSRLGGKEWESTKSRVKESVKNIAQELVELYAKRKANKGYRYAPDTVWQVSFEEEFPFEETNDQLRCIDEIKSDMESDIIMDRLLCGDVGYGKTEVALRAAFKAVMEGRQVAFLVPTTILAYQHYNTFINRMKNFPVNIELMCRFRSKKQQQRTLAGLRAGSVDIVVGTHRLLQKDVVFNKLGLLVVDEEQRFGVEHKETIKNYKSDIDVLTLTATPIPRTLHMSLSGIRDISVIEEPPAKRFPVQTYVMEYDADVVRDAVDREISRGGQVFYLYNRVQEMDSKYAKLSQMLGEDVRIGIAHGQMEENKLENVMVDFINGNYDVLLCTTIIESGLDIPNVNTMIIEDSDRMGLSQLYQIRGRVGRSDKVAYAYITHKHGKVITEDASRRLEAIREFTEFGSGFKIAMRDLEIRGAGSLLGANQHGHMERVGYDLYVRILNRAVKELGGQTITEEAEAVCTVELNANAYIDKEYIGSDLMRMEMYKKIAAIRNYEDQKLLMHEMKDRFTEPPEETKTLINIALLKNMAAASGISLISKNKTDINFIFKENVFPKPETLARLTENLPGRITVSMGTAPGIRLKCWLADTVDFKAAFKLVSVIAESEALR